MFLLQFLDLELNHQPQGLGARLPPSIIVAPPVVTLVPVIAPMTILVASLVTLAKRKHVTWAGGSRYIAYNICLKCQIRQILYVYHMYICLFLKEIIYDLNIVCEKIYTLYIFSIDTIYSIYCIYNKFYVLRIVISAPGIHWFKTFSFAGIGKFGNAFSYLTIKLQFWKLPHYFKTVSVRNDVRSICLTHLMKKTKQ